MTSDKIAEPNDSTEVRGVTRGIFKSILDDYDELIFRYEYKGLVAGAIRERKARLSLLLYNHDKAQARVAAIEQRLRDIAAGACGCSISPDFENEIGVLTFDKGATLNFAMAVQQEFRVDVSHPTSKTFTQLAERIEANHE